jgi:hypothetical protein
MISQLFCIRQKQQNNQATVAYIKYILGGSAERFISILSSFALLRKRFKSFFITLPQANHNGPLHNSFPVGAKLVQLLVHKVLSFFVFFFVSGKEDTPCLLQDQRHMQSTFGFSLICSHFDAGHHQFSPTAAPASGILFSFYFWKREWQFFLTQKREWQLFTPRPAAVATRVAATAPRPRAAFWGSQWRLRGATGVDLGTPAGRAGARSDRR